MDSEPPRWVEVRLIDGSRLEAPVLRIGTTSVFVGTDCDTLRHAEEVQLTLLDRQGPVLTFTGRTTAWVRRRGARIEVGSDTDEAVLERLAEWAGTGRNHAPLAGLPETGEMIPLGPHDGVSSSTPGAPNLRAVERPVDLPSPPQVAPPFWGKVTPPQRSGGVAPLGRNSAADVAGHPAAGSALSGTRVLVIEDDVNVLRLMERALRKFGCQVVGTDDPPRGLQLHADGAADVVLMDWVLPAIPGATLLQRLKETRSDIPVAVISGALWWEGAVTQIRSLGASQVLEKPVNFERLIDWLRAVRS
ncbi:MAG: response regulator [Myxococcota bacterium]